MTNIRDSFRINTNMETGIAYGYISADSLDPDVVNDLEMSGMDVYYEDNWQQFLAEKRTELGLDEGSDEDNEFAPDDYRDEFNDSYNPDEPVHEGTRDGVDYRTSWLGGALNLWVFFSPHVGRFRPCNPCVPGAADLNSPDPDGIEGYDVPPDWRDER